MQAIVGSGKDGSQGKSAQNLHHTFKLGMKTWRWLCRNRRELPLWKIGPEESAWRKVSRGRELRPAHSVGILRRGELRSVTEKTCKSTFVGKPKEGMLHRCEKFAAGREFRSLPRFHAHAKAESGSFADGVRHSTFVYGTSHVLLDLVTRRTLPKQRVTEEDVALETLRLRRRNGVLFLFRLCPTHRNCVINSGVLLGRSRAG
jgi:hypothetical protein